MNEELQIINETHAEELEKRFQKVRSIGEECIMDEELRNLLAKKPQFTAYDGFEPSGRMHIAQGILKSINVNKITSSGGKFIFWVADWFALLNNKMGGDLDKIKTVGNYMIEVWTAAGMDMENVEFIWSSDEILRRGNEYWSLVFDIATRTSLNRVLRCTQIMGRSESDSLNTSQIFYPVMQCADIFFLKVDICQLGMDQRKVNVLAREYCDEIKRKNKPIVLSHPLLMGLKEGQEKMSKSDPDSAIFMEDSEAEVNRKIKVAYCPPGIAEKNPILDYVRHIVFGKLDSFLIKRSERNGGNVAFDSYEALEIAYKAGDLHPGDLKAAVAEALNEFIRPVREHFASNSHAKQLLDTIKTYKITR